MHAINSVAMPCLPMLIYAFLLLRVRAMHPSNDAKARATHRATLMLSVQSAVIIFIHFTTCMTYLLAEYVIRSEVVVYIAHIDWMCMHG
ncbi:hypothetical protein PFISCL1PPCAC_13882, partial [Pristionchus fissidentatus]